MDMIRRMWGSFIIVVCQNKKDDDDDDAIHCWVSLHLVTAV